jgi:hypothetical protein
MNECLERVNGRHFWNPGVFSYATIPRCRPNSRVFFFLIVTLIVYASDTLKLFHLRVHSLKIACLIALQRGYEGLDEEDGATGGGGAKRRPTAAGPMKVDLKATLSGMQSGDVVGKLGNVAENVTKGLGKSIGGFASKLGGGGWF